MPWWKLGIYASIAWTLVVITLSVGSLWLISAQPRGLDAVETSAEQAGQLAGMALGSGLGLIWVLAWFRHLKSTWPTAGSSPRTLPTAATAACPKCSSTHALKVQFTWWGGLVGPTLFHHVKCSDCGTAFNGRTGRLNTIPIAIYVVVTGTIVLGLIVLVWNLWLA